MAVRSPQKKGFGSEDRFDGFGLVFENLVVSVTVLRQTASKEWTGRVNFSPINMSKLGTVGECL